MVSLQAPVGNNDENDKIAIALQKQKDRHRLFKRRFLANLAKLGLLMETVCLIKVTLFLFFSLRFVFQKGCS